MGDETKTVDPDIQALNSFLPPDTAQGGSNVGDGLSGFGLDKPFTAASASVGSGGSSAPNAKSPGFSASELFFGIGGAGVGSRFKDPEPQNLSAAKADYAGKDAAHEAARARFNTYAEQHEAALRLAEEEHAAAQAALAQKRAALDAATQIHAEMHPTGPAAVATAEELAQGLAPGTSTVEGSLSQGALRHSGKMGEIREANQVRKGIAGYRAGLPVSERVPLTGYTQSSRLIVPNELANVPLKTPAQIQADQLLGYAQDEHNAATTAAAEAQLKLENAQARPAAMGQTENILNKAEAARAGAKATLDEVDKARSFLSKIPFFNTAMGALSAAELVHAYREFQAGNTLEGVLSTMSGVGGAIALAPHPAAKAIGAAMGAVPLGYQLYQASKKPYDYRPNAGGGGGSNKAALPVIQ
jgi:hypothetical protein